MPYGARGYFNVRVTSTRLGREDHGIFILSMDFQGDGWGQGYVRVVTKETLFDEIDRILTTLEVAAWEDLPGTFCRVQKTGEAGLIEAIGHLIDDRWTNGASNINDKHAQMDAENTSE